MAALFRISLPGAEGSATRRCAIPSRVQHALYYDLTDTKLKSKTARDAENGPVSASGHFSFVGMEDSLLRRCVPAGDRPSVEQTTFADTVPE